MPFTAWAKTSPTLCACSRRTCEQTRKVTAGSACPSRADSIKACANEDADAPRPGAVRKITDEQVEALVTRTLTEKGRSQDSHWSTRSMAAETGLSQSSVSRIWRAFGLKPHLVETWKLSKDPEFIAKVCDVVGLCMSRPSTPWPGGGREVADPGAGPDRPGPADAAHDAGAAHARLRPPRDHQPVRGLRPGQRLGDRPALPPAPAIRSSCGSSSSSTPPSRRTWTCTSCWTTTPRTRTR
jgi:hypothetical protein